MNRYLELHVNGEQLLPRQPIGSAPYAFQTENSAQLDCLPSSGSQVRVLPGAPREAQGDQALAPAAGRLNRLQTGPM